jgi:GAF domain-containing protein/HAMP domain-containing protein
MEINPSRYPTLRTRLAVTLIVLTAVFSLIVSSLIYINFKRELRDSLRHRLENIASLAGLQQDGDTFVKVQAQGDEYFNRIHSTNLKIKSSDPDLRFVYTMRKVNGKIQFIVDAGLPGESEISAFGDPYNEPSQMLIDNFDTMTGTIVESDFYTDEFDTLLSAYTPILTSDGRRVGVLGVDITANTILAQERKFLFRLILVFLASLLLIIPAGILSANILAKPIVGLRNLANRMSEGDYSFKITDIPHTRELAELSLDFNQMSDKLSGLIYDLEQRVAERTGSLTRKTDQLRAASHIARQTAEIQELGPLLNMVANLVTGQFGFYHTGIFLMSETAQEVILQAASSEGGKRMIEKGHALAVGRQGIVGYVALQKKPRIAMDVGADAVFFNNPELPMTRSELALPLLIRERILGVLDIQSDKPEAFSVDDIDVLQTLADQIAVAIENARLLDESQAALQQLEAVTGVRTREAWRQKLQGRGRAFTYTPLGMRAGKVSASTGNTLKVPLLLRGQKIGDITIARKGNAALNRNEAELVTEVANQASQAIDNIRLLEEATQRANQEEIIGRLAGKFSQSLDTDTLLQTAVRELAQLADVSEVSVFLKRQTAEPSLNAAGGRFTRNNWTGLTGDTQTGLRGYKFDGTRLEPVAEMPELEKSVLERGSRLSSAGQNGVKQTTVAIPIKLRGQAVGVITVKLKEAYGEDTVSTIELASERLASALESARLYEEARLRADREQSIAQVTSAISASSSYEEILQTTIREIGNTLRDTEITIQITGEPTDDQQNG